ncbi:MAG: serine/threonine-protein kinase [Nannocystaceae bacterium]
MTSPTRLGCYELGAVIGRGGVAEVVRADVVGAGGFRKPVVIKRIRDELAPELRASLHAAFEREAVLAQRLQHPGVVAVLDLDEHGGQPFIVMEFVDGCSLQQLLDRGGSLPPALALHIALRVAEALAYVHALPDEHGAPLQLVHRDVTPANVLLSIDGAVKLADFGIARARSSGNDTLPGFVKGTPMYLAPEQAAGRPVDGRADVFALGLVLRRMLVGDGGLEALSPPLVAVIDRATEPAVRDRCDAAALVVALRGCIAQLGDDGDATASLAARVRELRGRSAARVVALDGALDRGSDGGTRQLAPAPAQPPARPRRRVAAVLAALVLAALAAVWLWPRDEPQPTTTATATAPRPTPRDEPQPARTPVAVPEPTVHDDDTTTGAAAAAPVKAAPPRPRARGRLKINLVPYARVTIDGRDRGQTPVDTPLSAGSHRVELYNPDSAQRRTIDVQVEPGQTASITAW